MARSNLVPQTFEWEKPKKVLFSVAIIVYVMEMQLTSTFMNAKGQCHLSTLAKKSLSQNFQSASLLKLLGQFQLNFICRLQAEGERKFIYFV